MHIWRCSPHLFLLNDDGHLSYCSKTIRRRLQPTCWSINAKYEVSVPFYQFVSKIRPNLEWGISERPTSENVLKQPLLVSLSFKLHLIPFSTHDLIKETSPICVIVHREVDTTLVKQALWLNSGIIWRLLSKYNAGWPKGSLCFWANNLFHPHRW